MMKADPVSGLLQTLKPRAGPLIITVFGDAIAPRSPDIWLGSLIAMMAQLGLSERLVRTGVYRLTRDGWLESRAQGRRSYYSLTDSGRNIFAEADARIYASSDPAWNGDWTLIQILPSLTSKKRQAVREALKWHGYGQLSPTLLVKPQRRIPQLALAKIGVLSEDEAVSVFTGRLEDLARGASLRTTASCAWDLAELNAAYRQFSERFSPFSGSSSLSSESAFALRILLTHEYRRILLKDPQLPAELLPHDWSGAAARKLAATVYRKIADRAEDFISHTLKNWQGELEPSTVLESRFA